MLATMLALRRSSEVDQKNVLQQLKILQKEQKGNTDLLNESIRLLADGLHSQSAANLDTMSGLAETCLESLHAIRQHQPKIQESGVLNWLSFRQITFRYEEVLPAYLETFSWIFLAPPTDDAHRWDDFSVYLRFHSTRPFFINGKAGSGKSTLMKYIVGHHDTHSLLSDWAFSNHKKLFVAEFFFWRLGTPLQKNKTGLLRGLLYKVLHAYPELIPDVFSHHYQN